MLRTRVSQLSAQPVTVLIDGRSGAGKSTVARQLVESWPRPDPVQLISMDDIYPGWEGLRAASESIITEVLEPRSRGVVGRWRRFDWGSGDFAEWHRVDPALSLLVEGCGCVTRASASLADLRVWLDSPAADRKRRALARDGEMFEPRWESWSRQEDALYATEGTSQLANLTLVNVTSAARSGGPR
ncbi:hypothetical protein [Klugiella xanthotipulae]|uniref:Uridine kinase n=1 Tax=Klugiella xanthotipulae TaxID=244735 RepID=A0A543HRZ6_9MICO|nr:hypothetical protein [Klugiella xanthotipulae]TQM61110.1 hypothetical protein FB466_2039 [Klugiella xanthotipulae]